MVSESEVNDELLELDDVISQDNDEDPSVQAAGHPDWNALCQSRSELEMLPVNGLVNGLGIREAVELAQVNYSTGRNDR